MLSFIPRMLRSILGPSLDEVLRTAYLAEVAPAAPPVPAWTPNKAKPHRDYCRPARVYLQPSCADSQVGIVLRALVIDGRSLTSLDAETLLSDAGNPVIDGGRPIRYCKAIIEASGCTMQERIVLQANGKRVKLRWVNLTDRQRLCAS